MPNFLTHFSSRGAEVSKLTVAAAFFLFYFFLKCPPLRGHKKIFFIFYFLFYANLGAKIQVAADLAVTKPSILPRNFNEIRKVYDYLHYMKKYDRRIHHSTSRIADSAYLI